MNELFLGIDLGGSHISAWFLDRKGNTHNPFSKIGINSNLSSEELVNHLMGFINVRRAPMWNYNVLAVGLASPGPLDPHQGIIISPPNLPNIKNLEVVKILRDKTDLPTFLVNDADAALLSEHWLGSAKGFKNVVMLTLGTGVGSGVILNWRLQRGHGMAAEWGHTTIKGAFNSWISRGDRLCSCGRFNCLESFCSTEGLAQTYCEVFGVRRKDLFPDFVNEISKEMRKKRSDFRWYNLSEIYCRDLVEGIINIVNVHQPDCVILGGGIAYGSMAEKVKVLLQDATGNKLNILAHGVDVCAAANLQSGVIGAAKYAMDSYDAQIEKYRMEYGVYS